LSNERFSWITITTWRMRALTGTAAGGPADDCAIGLNAPAFDPQPQAVAIATARQGPTNEREPVMVAPWRRAGQRHRAAALSHPFFSESATGWPLDQSRVCRHGSSRGG
jgi:hypothetical protein